jgi:UDP-glucose 4-epimerase
MKTLCTGGAGYVGSACLRFCLANGHDAVAFDNLGEGNRGAVPEGRLFEGNILDREALVQVMRAERIEAVMHFAALASVPNSIGDPERYYRVNVLGTQNVLDAMVETGVERLVFSSTAATYDHDNALPLSEDARLAPAVPYGRTKLCAEWLIRDYARAYGLGCSVLRYFNASGADADGRHGEDHRHESHLVPLVLSAAARGREPVKVYGGDWDTRDGTCVRDYVHVEDLARAHQLCLESGEAGTSRVYNLGTGTGVTVLEVIRACEEVVGRRIAADVAPRRPGDPAALVASPARIKAELGWSPRYRDITSIVETAWRWHSSHPRGYGER